MKLIKFNSEHINSEAHVFFETEQAVAAFYSVLDNFFEQVKYHMIYDGKFPLEEVGADYRTYLTVENMSQAKYDEVCRYMSSDSHLEGLIDTAVGYYKGEDKEDVLVALGYR